MWVKLGRSHPSVLSVGEITASSTEAWEGYWSNSGFVDVVTGSTDERADELQRRIILSRYLMRVNEAGDYPPQEVGAQKLLSLLVHVLF